MEERKRVTVIEPEKATVNFSNPLPSHSSFSIDFIQSLYALCYSTTRMKRAYRVISDFESGTEG